MTQTGLRTTDGPHGGPDLASTGTGAGALAASLDLDAPAPELTPLEQETARRMEAHELYTEKGTAWLARERRRTMDLVDDFNGSRLSEAGRRDEIVRELFAHVGRGVWLEPTLRVAYGNRASFGDDVFVNFGLTLVNDVDVVVGDRVMIAPNVVITTTGHPVHPDHRRDREQFSAPVVLEEDVWIGAGAVILPGVTVGRGSVVAAGAVVGANVPPMTVVGGVPARVLRPITDADREWTYRAPRTMPLP